MVVKLTKVNSRDKNKCPQGRHAAMFPLFVFSPVFQVHWVFKFPIGQIESKSTARYLFTLRDIPIFSLACGILWPTESCGLWTCCGVLFSWILHWLPALWPSHFIVFSGKQLPSPPDHLKVSSSGHIRIRVSEMSEIFGVSFAKSCLLASPPSSPPTREE